jgi:hypothetical protein
MVQPDHESRLQRLTHFLFEIKELLPWHLKALLSTLKPILQVKSKLPFLCNALPCRTMDRVRIPLDRTAVTGGSIKPDSVDSMCNRPFRSLNLALLCLNRRKVGTLPSVQQTGPAIA